MYELLLSVLLSAVKPSYHHKNLKWHLEYSLTADCYDTLKFKKAAAFLTLSYHIGVALLTTAT
jgi:hypothetical protein